MRHSAVVIKTNLNLRWSKGILFLTWASFSYFSLSLSFLSFFLRLCQCSKGPGGSSSREKTQSPEVPLALSGSFSREMLRTYSYADDDSFRNSPQVSQTQSQWVKSSILLFWNCSFQWALCMIRSHGTKTPCWMANEAVKPQKPRGTLFKKI